MVVVVDVMLVIYDNFIACVIFYDLTAFLINKCCFRMSYSDRCVICSTWWH